MTIPSLRRALLAAVVVAPLAVGTARPAAAHERDGNDGGSATTVYTETNATSGNEILAFHRTANGLAPTGRVAAGGTGTGAGLGSQGAVTLVEGGDALLAVDAGSDQVSLLERGEDGSLRLADVAPSGGDQPVSVTVHDHTVYVLNAGDGTVSGLRLSGHRLRPIAGSTQHLTGAAGAQVSFTPSGRQLVVTEKATNSIDVFPVGRDGRAGAPVANASSGTTPFGFEFDASGHLLVSNAAGGAPGASSVTSYRVQRDGHLAVLDGPTAIHQSAACWVVVAGPYAYTTNTASGNVTGLQVGGDGSLALLRADGVSATTGAGPIDAAAAGGELFTLNSGAHTITVHGIGADGSLTPATTASGLPAGIVGLAAG